MTRRLRAAASAACSGDAPGGNRASSMGAAMSGTLGRLADRCEFEHRVTLGDRRELGSGRSPRNWKVALHGQREAVEIGLEQRRALEGTNLAHHELLASASLAQRDAARRASVAHPVGLAARRDQIAALLDLKQVDGRGKNPAAFAPPD